MGILTPYHPPRLHNENVFRPDIVHDSSLSESERQLGTYIALRSLAAESVL